MQIQKLKKVQAHHALFHNIDFWVKSFTLRGFYFPNSARGSKEKSNTVSLSNQQPSAMNFSEKHWLTDLERLVWDAMSRCTCGEAARCVIDNPPSSIATVHWLAFEIPLQNASTVYRISHDLAFEKTRDCFCSINGTSNAAGVLIFYLQSLISLPIDSVEHCVSEAEQKHYYLAI